LKTVCIGILLAATLVAYPNGDPARASNPALELRQLASLPLGTGESFAHTTLPDVTVLAPPTYSEPLSEWRRAPCDRSLLAWR
jgi:hypothetical protein